MKTKKQRKYLKKQKIQHRHNKRLKFIPMSVATYYDFIWADLKGPRWRARRKVREKVREYEKGRVFQYIAYKYAANDIPMPDYYYKYDVPSYTDYICNHTYSDGKSAIISNKDDLLSLVALENANKNYDSKTEVKEGRLIPYFSILNILRKE